MKMNSFNKLFNKSFVLFRSVYPNFFISLQKVRRSAKLPKKFRLLPLQPRMFRHLQKSFYCDNPNVTEEEKEKEIERIMQNASIDEPPTACCRSGCANCVFIVWAEALASKFENAGPEITDKIMKTVEDPSMKAYLELELRIRGLKKS